MRRNAHIAALRAKVEMLKSTDGFIELRQPDGRASSYRVVDFCHLLDEMRGSVPTDRTARLIADLRHAANLDEYDTFTGAIASMVWEGGERRVIPDLSEAPSPPRPADTPPAEPYRRPELSELSTAQRRKRWASSRR